VTRVIAGTARGRRLSVPAGRHTRPTSDRAREGLFGTLLTLGGDMRGLRVLDLYAGSGAVGLEALSRGAGHVLFVEADPRAARVIRDNLAAVGLPGGELVTDRVDRLLERGPGAGGGRYDLVVADPPYRMPDAEVTGMLAGLASGGWLAPGAVVAVERATRSGAVGWPPGYLPDRSRRYGDTTFWYGLAADAHPAQQP
jgi:16S rRNA (guanine966-N2)-methyltransferase